MASVPFIEKKTVYKLIDPIHNYIGYIGETSQPLNNRLSNHISDALGAYPKRDGHWLSRNPLFGLTIPVLKSKVSWILWLNFMGIKPIIEAINNDLSEYENAKKALKHGYVLSNTCGMPSATYSAPAFWQYKKHDPYLNAYPEIESILVQRKSNGAKVNELRRLFNGGFRLIYLCPLEI